MLNLGGSFKNHDFSCTSKTISKCECDSRVASGHFRHLVYDLLNNCDTIKRTTPGIILELIILVFS